MDHSELGAAQARTNRHLSQFVPRHVWQSTVAIVVANRPAVHLLGSGSLFEISNRRFVVTAAHVVKLAKKHDKTIGITGDSGSLIALGGEWIVSTSETDDDPFDVALCQLPTSALHKLKQYRFNEIVDADFDGEPRSAVYTVFGHPGIWATPSRNDMEEVQVKGLEYTAYTYERSVENLLGYEPKFHLLLDAEAEQISWRDGSKAILQKRDGSDALFPRDLKGISGGPVWRISDLSIPLKDWHRVQPRLAGVQTGVYQPSQVIRVTRWAAVTTLIHAAFPELRSAIESHGT
jgi:hypothetical protein